MKNKTTAAPWIPAVLTRPINGILPGTKVYVRRARTEAGYRVLAPTGQFVVAAAKVGEVVKSLRIGGKALKASPTKAKVLDAHLAWLFKSTLPVAFKPVQAKVGA